MNFDLSISINAYIYLTILRNLEYCTPSFRILTCQSISVTDKVQTRFGSWLPGIVTGPTCMQRNWLSDLPPSMHEVGQRLTSKWAIEWSRLAGSGQRKVHTLQLFHGLWNFNHLFCKANIIVIVSCTVLTLVQVKIPAVQLIIVVLYHVLF